MRILVTISRDWDDYEAIIDELHAACQGVSFHKVTVVHGASQMDWFIAGVAYAYGMDTEPHDADWDRHGKGAGMVRNTAMAASGADICLAFIKNRSSGATDCAGKAERAGITTKRITR